MRRGRLYELLALEGSRNIILDLIKLRMVNSYQFIYHIFSNRRVGGPLMCVNLSFASQFMLCCILLFSRLYPGRGLISVEKMAFWLARYDLVEYHDEREKT